MPNRILVPEFVTNNAAMQADQASAAIRDAFTSGRHDGVVVDSPARCRKTTLVVATAIHLAHTTAEPVMIVAQTNDQADDLVARLAHADTSTRIGRLHSSEYSPSARVQHPNVSLAQQITDLGDADITVATGKKWRSPTPPPVPYRGRGA